MENSNENLQTEGHKHEAPTNLPPGWTLPNPDEIPLPTYWPVVLGVGIVLMAFGVVTTFLVSLIGLILFLIALFGWLGDIQNEQRTHH